MRIKMANKKPKNMFEKTKSVNNLEEVVTSNEKFMNKVKLWTSFYRKYPFMFCKDFLNLNLKLFQKILLYLMFNFNFFMFIASRGRLLPCPVIQKYITYN